MTDSLWTCPQCSRQSTQPPNVTAVKCMNFTGHKRNVAVEMERKNAEDEN